MKINLKKLIADKELSVILNNTIRLLDGPIGILDKDGQLLFGENSNSQYKFPIQLAEDLFGWIIGSDKGIFVASLLSYLLGKELEKKQLAHETLDKYKEITLLYDMSEKITAKLNREEVVQLILEEVKKLIKGDNVSIMLQEKGSETLKVTASKKQGKLDDIKFKPGEGIAGNVFQSGKAEIINDVLSDSRFIKGKYKISSMMCAPLKTKSEVFGIINLSSQEPISYTARDLRLFTTLTSQAAIALKNVQYIQFLKEVTAIRQRVESELKIAHNIQMSLLPQKFPRDSKFEVHAMIEPALEVGGDFYDFIKIDQDTLWFAIGDVSGKGIPAALFMAVTKTLLKATIHKNRSPHEILTIINKELSQENESCMFVTIFCGFLNTSTGEINYANGGHTTPLIIRSGQEVASLKMDRGGFVGVLDFVTFGTGKVVLCPGDSLLMYTDGVIEAENDKRELYSKQRLLTELNDIQDLSVHHFNAQKLTAGIMRLIETFSQGVLQSDDITMLALKYKGK